MKILKPIIALALVALTLVACQNDVPDDATAGSAQMRDINISIPALTAGTRASADPNNPLKTTWDVGDKVYIRISDPNDTFTAKFTATYTTAGWEFSAPLQVPMDVIRIWINAIYIGSHQPCISPAIEDLFDTDILYSATPLYSLADHTDGHVIPLVGFDHYCSRIRFTGLAAGDKIEFQGNQWQKVSFNSDDYALYSVDFETADNLTIAASQNEAVLYTRIYSSIYNYNAPEFRINGGDWYDFDPGAANDGNNYFNRTYVVDCTGLTGGGGIEKLLAEEAAAIETETQRFITWAQGTGEGNWETEGFELKYDIDISRVDNWVPIRGFQHSFDGDGHTIRGLNIDRETEYNVGLFGYSNGTIRNLTVEGNIIGNMNTGGIVGYMDNGIISGCTFRGTVTGKDIGTGGIAGCNEIGLIAGCQVMDSHITGFSTVGGIVGNNATSNAYTIACLVSDVTLETTSTIEDANLGGITAYNYRMIACVTASSEIKMASGPYNIYTGRIAGQNESSGTIANCYWQNDTEYGTAIGREENPTSQEDNCTKFAAGYFPAISAINEMNAAIDVYNTGHVGSTMKCPFKWEAGAEAGALPKLVNQAP